MPFARKDGIGTSSEKSSSSFGMTLLPPSLRREMRHMLVRISRHPLMMVSPLNETSHPVEWKNTSQPASHNTDTEIRLLMMVGA